MTEVIDATEQDWNGLVREGGPLIVDFWAPWCGWCRRLAPAFERLAHEFTGRVRFVRVNVEEEPHLAERFGVQVLPTLKLFCDGQVVEEVLGFLPEALLRKKIAEALLAPLACEPA